MTRTITRPPSSDPNEHPPRRLRTAALVALILLVAALSQHAPANGDIRLLQYGSWGLATDPDPFKNKYPAVIYVPPGTIVFDTREGPLRNYLSVQLHYGHWVQIEKTTRIKDREVDVLVPIEGLVEPPPSQTIMIHRSILCLGQTNRIATPPARCKPVADNPASTLPVGKGWIYTYEPSPKPDWVDLSVQLDAGTRQTLAERGLDPALADFDIARGDLLELEKQGYLTVLDKAYPQAVFEYQNRRPVYIACGQQKVTEKNLRASARIEAEGGVGYEAPLWARFVTGLKARLGLTVAGEAAAGTGTTWTISVDTSQASYLYYTATMTDTVTGETSNIIIEKIFECRPSPNIGPGNRITSVRFEMEPPDGVDLQEFEFTDPTDYLPVPEALYNHHPRPIFVSINSPPQYETALRRIIERWDVDVHLAHFMLTNINYSCTSSGRTRSKCASLIARQIDSP